MKLAQRFKNAFKAFRYEAVGNAPALHPGSRFRALGSVLAPVGRSPLENC